jgi:hypothetical protein
MIKNINEINSFVKLIDIIGYIAPNILFILSCYLLWNKTFLLIYYFIGFFMNILMNIKYHIWYSPDWCENDRTAR